MRPEKVSIVAEVRGQLEKSKYLLLADCRGMKVEQMTDLRGKLRQSHSRLQVVKNSYLGVVAKELGYGPALAKLLAGPTAMITGSGDGADAVKLLKAFAKDNNRPAIKGGVFGGQVLSVKDVELIATLPNRDVMLAMFLGTLNAPMGKLVGVLNQKVLTLLYALKAVEEKKSKDVAASN